VNKLENCQTKYKSTLIKLGNHSVLAIIVLIAIGSATRVMEAGLACPDWPLCYGTFLPLSHMNVRVFLEWFHRLDAFLVGLLILVQFFLSIIWRRFLPKGLLKVYSFLLFLVIFQGSLGALTVINTLASSAVISHLLIAFSLLITAIYIIQNLQNEYAVNSKLWWKFLLTIPLLLTLIQSAIGVRLSSTWSAHLCLSVNQNCLILNSHKLFALPVSISIIAIFVVAAIDRNLFINNYKFLILILFLLGAQITLGVLSLKTNLNQPLIVVSHQLVASLLIANLSTLVFRNQDKQFDINSLKEKVIFSYN
tara:strand:+ start:181 stop:1104 length:924 start_codon:yes stop_codon:yes gene_type:complete